MKKCGKFIYGGCGGNENNFATLEDCHKRCRPNKPGTCSMSMQIDMDNQILFWREFLGDCFRLLCAMPIPKRQKFIKLVSFIDGICLQFLWHILDCIFLTICRKPLGE